MQQKTTSEEWESMFNDIVNSLKWELVPNTPRKIMAQDFEVKEVVEEIKSFISTLIAQKQKEAIEVERQKIWDIIVDEFAELQLYFHEGSGGSRISKCQEKIVERIKIIQNAKEKFDIKI